jgi:hypothetical protein
MNLDELDKEIRNIKKQGLPFILEQSHIADVRAMFYDKELNKQQNKITERFHNNVALLSRLHRVLVHTSKFKEYMGMNIKMDFNDFIKFRGPVRSMYYVILVALFYGVPAELLLFEDLTLHEERIKTNYPFIFK